MNIVKFFDKLEDKVRGSFSHFPIAYGFVAGIGIVLFWRGVWHTADVLHLYVAGMLANTTIDWALTPWWDGPVSFMVGSVLLLMTGAFVSSFIGNEIIMSGLRGEKKLTERTETEVRTEVGAIARIHEELVLLRKELKKPKTAHEPKRKTPAR